MKKFIHLRKFNESHLIKEKLSYEYGTVSNLESQLEDIFEEILPPMIYYDIKIKSLKETSKIRIDNPSAICMSVTGLFTKTPYIIMRSWDHFEIIKDFKEKAKVFGTVKDLANYIAENAYESYQKIRKLNFTWKEKDSQ